ncbi:hypothetical protein LSM04_009500 [Trypanosoma melophagium]|nr:hypothetical protein LSM04_009500 [Trypanosoma melophagium]
MPHMFRSERDLTTYIEMLQHVEHSHEAREQAVQYMLQRMPMTETFLYSLWYLCDAQVHAAHKSKQTRSGNGNSNSNNSIGSVSDSAAGRSVHAAHTHSAPMAVSETSDTPPIQTTKTKRTTTMKETTDDDAPLQSAATLLFIANALLLEHETLERPGRYRAVFNAYIPRMVELLARTAPPKSQVALYVQKTVSVWAMEGTFTGDALQRMQHAVG